MTRKSDNEIGGPRNENFHYKKKIGHMGTLVFKKVLILKDKHLFLIKFILVPFQWEFIE